MYAVERDPYQIRDHQGFHVDVWVIWDLLSADPEDYPSNIIDFKVTNEEVSQGFASLVSYCFDFDEALDYIGALTKETWKDAKETMSEDDPWYPDDDASEDDSYDPFYDED